MLYLPTQQNKVKSIFLICNRLSQVVITFLVYVICRALFSVGIPCESIKAAILWMALFSLLIVWLVIILTLLVGGWL